MRERLNVGKLIVELKKFDPEASLFFDEDCRSLNPQRHRITYVSKWNEYSNVVCLNEGLTPDEWRAESEAYEARISAKESAQRAAYEADIEAKVQERLKELSK